MRRLTMFGLGFQEILLLFLIALLLFGSKRLPDVGRALGQTIREFKKAMQDDHNEHSAGEKPEHGDQKQA
jgi:TatA/E family protein of Tat protein translocase